MPAGPGRTPKVSDRVIEQALIANGGVLAAVSDWIKTNHGRTLKYRALQYRVSGSKRLREVQGETVDKILDLCDTKLIEMIKAGNLGAIIWYQRNKGRHRGWGLSALHNAVNQEEAREILLDAIRKTERIFPDAPEGSDGQTRELWVVPSPPA